jgi:ubiquinone/menaquinone biosynthesis C-methylase UbiE
MYGVDMERKSHWENVFETKAFNGVSWYRSHLDCSLQLIEQTGVGNDGHIIDVGGGNSNLVDDLQAQGHERITVLDISSAALQQSQARLGAQADRIQWIEADITQASLPPQQYDVWHDRAVFHFLTEPEDRQKYVEQVQRALKPQGHIIVATFALDGPPQCSGLNVMRYDSTSLHYEFGSNFEPVDQIEENHLTPFGTQQAFLYCYCRKR